MKKTDYMLLFFEKIRKCTDNESINFVILSIAELAHINNEKAFGFVASPIVGGLLPKAYYQILRLHEPLLL